MEVLGTWSWHSKVLDLDSQHSQLYANIVKVAADLLVKFLERGNDIDKITAYGHFKVTLDNVYLWSMLHKLQAFPAN